MGKYKQFLKLVYDILGVDSRLALSLKTFYFSFHIILKLTHSEVQIYFSLQETSYNAKFLYVWN